jgi:hypothetical protein
VLIEAKDLVNGVSIVQAERVDKVALSGCRRGARALLRVAS